MARRLPAALSALLASLALAGAAHAAPTVSSGSAQPVTGGGKAGSVRASSASLWATINLCDTPESPNEMGVRASMPGNGLAQRMYVRFTAQYYRTAGGWRTVRGSGRSPWLRLGSARYRERQGGWTFELEQPPLGKTWTMRAKAHFQWRAKKRVKRSRGSRRRRSRRSSKSRWVVKSRRTRYTRSGVPGVAGGDPPGTSKALCLIF